VAKFNLIDPTRDFDPGDLLNFFELDAFTLHWSRLGLTDNDLTALQMFIMRNPAGSPVIRGTSGVRKMRFAPPRAARGKSGGVRVCYVYFKKYGIVLLATVYAKNEESDVTEAQKRAMANKVGEIEKYLREYYGF
jgi:hypothetical protein